MMAHLALPTTWHWWEMTFRCAWATVSTWWGTTLWSGARTAPQCGSHTASCQTSARTNWISSGWSGCGKRTCELTQWSRGSSKRSHTCRSCSSFTPATLKPSLKCCFWDELFYTLMLIMLIIYLIGVFPHTRSFHLCVGTWQYGVGNQVKLGANPQPFTGCRQAFLGITRGKGCCLACRKCRIVCSVSCVA